MGIMKYIDKARGAYLTYKTKKVVIPEIEKSKTVRKKFIFSGKVQRVGFRLETYEIGKRLDLRGWVKNKDDGRVEAEIQGEIAKINYLISHLKSLKRLSIDNLAEKDLPLKEDEKEFKIIY